MTTWTSDELATIGTAAELQIASLRRDGTLGSPRTVWVVRLGDDLYVRSVNGRSSAWFRATQVRREGHIQAGGLSRRVAFADAGPGINDELDAAYRAKYRRYAANIVGSVVSPQARAATVILVPQPASS